MTTVDGLRDLMAEHGIPAKGVVHVGAHLGQEVPLYRSIGFNEIILIEANPHLADRLREIYPREQWLEVFIRNLACASSPGTRTLHITEQDKLSSIYKPLTRRIVETVEIATEPLSDLIHNDINVAVIDVQGAELEVVSGAPLDTLDVIVLETHRRSKYAGAPGTDEALQSMKSLGWTDAAHWFHDPKGKLRDVAFVKEQS